MSDYKPIQRLYCSMCVLPFPQQYIKNDTFINYDDSSFICQMCYIKKLQDEVKNKTVTDKIDECNCCKNRLGVLLSDIDNYLNN